MKKDAYGLKVTTHSDKAITEINFFTQELLRVGKKLDAIITSARNHPDVLLIQCFAAAFHLYAQSDSSTLKAKEYLNKAQHILSFGNHREKMFYYAVAAWQQRDYELAIILLEAITELYPCDAATAKIAEWLFYCTGQVFQAKRFLAMCKKMHRYQQQNSHFLAMQAFALELCGHYSESYEMAQHALEIEFFTPWAHHALAHIYLMQGQIDPGITALKSFQPSWEDSFSLLESHNTWHLALLHWVNLNLNQASLLYDRAISPNNSLQQFDAISLLWRMEMTGFQQTKHWKNLGNHIGQHLNGHYLPYNDAHFVYALVKMGNEPAAYQAIEEIDRYSQTLVGETYRVWHTIGKPLIQGSFAFAKEDYENTAALLKPIIDNVFCVGGSDVQDELFLQTYLTSLIKSKQHTLAKKFFKKYLSHYTTTPLGESWLVSI